MNLVLCLLSARQYLTADRIRDIVPGYRDAGSDEAFARMFERDKAELRELGVPVETGRNSAFEATDGYRIARRDYELPDIDLEPDEAAAVALAARLWDSPELAGAASAALVKLRAAGIDVHADSPVPVEPRIRAAGPAFGPLVAAVQTGRVVRFDHRKQPGAPARQRTVEPWGVVSYRGRWYLVGHDRDRDDVRCFRLSRIVSQVLATGRAGAVTRPDGVDLLKLVIRSAGPPSPSGTAVLWLADDRAHGLRRRATVLRRRVLDEVPGEEVELDLPASGTAARWIAGHGPDVVVLEPPSLQDAVLRLLRAATGAGPPGADPHPDGTANRSAATPGPPGDGVTAATGSPW